MQGQGLTGKQSGFTLIELLIVIVIITALAVTVFVALNPVKRLLDARDSRRRTDIETIMTAVHEYIIDNGNLPPSLSTGTSPNQDYQIGTAIAGSCPAISTGGCSTNAVNKCVDFTTDLIKYLKSIPIDPLGLPNNAPANTGYAVSYTPPTYIITVKACRTGTGTTEGANNISLSR